jgi:hypothetical protein
VLVRKGVYQDIIEFEDFVRGFTWGKTLFDFVDVGAGKDRADEKIIGERIWISCVVRLSLLTMQNHSKYTLKIIIVVESSSVARTTMATHERWSSAPIVFRLSTRSSSEKASHSRRNW